MCQSRLAHPRRFFILRRWRLRNCSLLVYLAGAGCKPSCCAQPRATPGVDGDALIKVSRSVRATSFMRGIAPRHCGLRAQSAWHFCVRKNAECFNRCVRPPRALPWAGRNNWAFSPPQPSFPAAHSAGVFNKIGCGSAISSKLDCTRLALSLQNAPTLPLCGGYIPGRASGNYLRWCARPRATA